jgi:hypothetical protein
VIIVSVTAKDECNSLKCRSVPIPALEQAFSAKARTISITGQKCDDPAAADVDLLLSSKLVKGTKLFKDFCLRYPDFIEFDELNAKIITKHSVEDAYRVWSLQTY